jgi:hypothetical protein
LGDDKAPSLQVPKVASHLLYAGPDVGIGLHSNIWICLYSSVVMGTVAFVRNARDRSAWEACWWLVARSDDGKACDVDSTRRQSRDSASLKKERAQRVIVALCGDLLTCRFFLLSRSRCSKRQKALRISPTLKFVLGRNHTRAYQKNILRSECSLFSLSKSF